MSKSDFRSINTHLNSQQLSESPSVRDFQEIAKPDLS